MCKPVAFLDDVLCVKNNKKSFFKEIFALICGRCKGKMHIFLMTNFLTHKFIYFSFNNHNLCNALDSEAMNSFFLICIYTLFFFLFIHSARVPQSD